MNFFIWLAKHEKVMTNVEKKKRGFTGSDTCHKCPGNSESVDHILRRCPSAEEVWTRLAPGMVTGRSWTETFGNWLDNNVRIRDAKEGLGTWNAAFAIICWWLWKWRNEEVFNNMTKDLEQKVTWLRNQCSQNERAFRQASRPGGNATDKGVVWVRWGKPDQGWMKLNTNGSVNPTNNHAGSRGVIRDEHGMWSTGFAFNVGTCSIDEAEARAILTGLKIAWDKGIRKLWVESDSKRVVDEINDASGIGSAAGNLENIIRECKRFKEKD